MTALEVPLMLFSVTCSGTDEVLAVVPAVPVPAVPPAVVPPAVVPVPVDVAAVVPAEVPLLVEPVEPVEPVEAVEEINALNGFLGVMPANVFSGATGAAEAEPLGVAARAGILGSGAPAVEPEPE